MKKITFNNVLIKNFLSIGDNPVSLSFQKGINLITGENKDKGGANGVGKSSILEAIYWCLFGNTIRDIKTDKIIHNLTNKGGEVSINFDVENIKTKTNYTLTRSLKPSKLKLVINSDKEEDVTLSTIPETEKYIKDLIGGSEELFQNAIIMSSNNTVPFMAQKKVDKRKFIEGILNLNIFSDILLKARGEYNDVKKQNDLLSHSFVSEQRILESLKNSKDNFDESKDTRIKVVQAKITSASSDLQFLKEQNVLDVNSITQEIKKQEEHIEILKKGLKETNEKSILIGKEYTQAYDRLRDAKKDKKKILDKGDTCPTCNRIYCKEDLDHVANEIAKLDKIINETQPIHDQLEQKKQETEDFATKIVEKIDSKKEKIKELKEDITKASLHEQKIQTLLEKIEEYRENVREIETESFKDDDKIAKSKENIKKLEVDLLKIKKEMEILESVKFIVSEEGVKTFIIKKLLNLFNSKINYYLKLLDTPCKCEFNELFEETITNDQGKECSYFNFSGGERKRIDIAVLFTFQDILRSQNGTSYSFNIYDELFDSAIDDKGIDKILDILRQKVEKYNEAIYIVSHKSSTRTNIDNVLTLEKEKGVTKLLQ